MGASKEEALDRHRGVDNGRVQIGPNEIGLSAKYIHQLHETSINNIFRSSMQTSWLMGGWMGVPQDQYAVSLQFPAL